MLHRLHHSQRISPEGADLPCRAHRAAEKYPVFSDDQHPCGTLGVEADHAAFGDGERQKLLLTGGKKNGFFKCHQFFFRLLQLPLGLREIDLHYLPPGDGARVPHCHDNGEGTILIGAAAALPSKGGVGQTVPERIPTPRSVRKTLKIAVAHIDVFLIDRIQPSFRVVGSDAGLAANAVIEVAGGRNVLIALRPGVRQSAGRIDPSGEYVHHGLPGKHSAEAAIHQRVYLIPLHKGKTHRVAHVQNDHQTLEASAKRRK